MIKFNAKLLAATALAQSVNETRSNLCGVYFDGKCAIATNGQMLTISHDPDSHVDENGIYPVSKKAITAMKKNTAKTVIIRDGVLSVCLSVCDENNACLHMESCIEVSSTYPDYHGCIPGNFGEATLACFSHFIIKEVCETQKILNGTAFRITGENDSAPHVVSYSGYKNILSVVMPCRGNSHLNALPEWYVRPDTTKDNQTRQKITRQKRLNNAMEIVNRGIPVSELVQTIKYKGDRIMTISFQSLPSPLSVFPEWL